jgi:hypothetical protein
VHGNKPVAFHLVVYGSKAYALNKRVPKLNRLDPRAFIGYLVGYKGTNIYRIWIPSQGEVIRSRDVVFNKDEYMYDPSEIDSLIMYPEAVQQRLTMAPLPTVPELDNLLEYISVSDVMVDKPIEATRNDDLSVTTKEIFESWSDEENEVEKNPFSTPLPLRGENPASSDLTL